MEFLFSLSCLIEVAELQHSSNQPILNRVCCSEKVSECVVTLAGITFFEPYPRQNVARTINRFFESLQRRNTQLMQSWRMSWIKTVVLASMRMRKLR